MSELVKLPKEDAKMIESIRNFNKRNPLTKYGVLEAFAEIRPNHCELDTIMTALVNGYEVEETPRGKVREYYQLFEHGSNRETFNALMVQDIIEKVLDLLNIKIEGVNK